MSDLCVPSRPERPYSASRIRGESDGGSLPRVDRGTEERVDPTVPLGPPGERGEIRVPDPPRAPRQVERLLRPQGGDAVPGATAARGAGVRPEPVAGAGERHASEVLPAHGPRADRADGGARDLGRDDRRRRARPGGRPMTAPDEYLGQVRRAMAGMEPKVRDDILSGVGARVAGLAPFGVVAERLAGAGTSQAGLALLVSASVMLLVLGWIPGTAKRAWSAPRVEL